jgi:hypothetical protein
MSVLPDSRLALVEFCEQHVPIFTANAVAIGVTPAAVTAMDNLAKAARAKHTAQQIARDAAKAATGQFYNAEDLLRDSIADLVRIIKTHAEVTNNPNVYTLAQIDPPSPPTPRAAPGQPNTIKVELLTGGQVKFTWKSANAGGGYFTIKRRLAGTQDPFIIAGSSDRRNFVDVTLPGGGGPWEYAIQGFRSTSMGPAAGPESDHLIVSLGAGGLQVSGAATMKIAA